MGIAPAPAAPTTLTCTHAVGMCARWRMVGRRREPWDDVSALSGRAAPFIPSGGRSTACSQELLPCVVRHRSEAGGVSVCTPRTRARLVTWATGRRHLSSVERAAPLRQQWRPGARRVAHTNHSAVFSALLARSMYSPSARLVSCERPSEKCSLHPLFKSAPLCMGPTAPWRWCRRGPRVFATF